MDIPKQEKRFVLTNLYNKIPKTKRNSLSFGNAKQKTIIVITDAGEECDDEVTIASILKYSKSSDKFKFIIICTDDNWVEHLGSLGLLEDINKNVLFFGIANEKEIQKNIPKECFYLLQIGPVKNENTTFIKLFEKHNFKYFLLGGLGSTLNSKINYADNFSKSIIGIATDTYIINTSISVLSENNEKLIKMLAPPFTIKSVKQLNNDNVEDLVKKIGFRNTVGRAHPAGGKHIVHLIGNHGGGANYNTVKQQVEQICGLNISGKKIPQDKEIEEVVEDYINTLSSGPVKIELGGDGEILNSSNKGITLDNIKNGFSYILYWLNKLYSVPIKLYISGIPGGWNKIWTNGFIGDKALEESYNIFSEIIEKNPELPLTPAYDCMGLLAVFACNSGSIDKCFSTQQNEKLKEEYEKNVTDLNCKVKDSCVLIQLISNPEAMD